MKKYQKRKALEQLIPAETQKVLIAGEYHTSTVCLKSPKSCGQHANSMVTMVVTTWIPVLLLLPHNMTQIPFASISFCEAGE